MHIGIQTTFFGGRNHESVGDFVAGVGKALEERGFHSLWTGEHVVTFPKYDPASRYSYSDDGAAPQFLADFGFMDPLTMLTALAGHTSTLKLGTGIAILPQRNPVYFAKMATGIDLLSNGRFLAGLGVGWSAQEYAATETPYEHRGARLDEYIEVVRSLWCDEVASFKGKFYTLPECKQMPKPAQSPHPPLFIGGESNAALRRVAKYGQGWYGFRLPPDELAARMPILEAELSARGRSFEDLEVVISPGDKPCDRDTLARYAELGVSEVIVICVSDSLAGFVDQADALAERFVVPAHGL
jgi:probable F420-dependent oxidoreductase